jgi:hypothetical protein
MTEREKLIEVMARAIVNAHNYLPPQANHGPERGGDSRGMAIRDAVTLADYSQVRMQFRAGSFY